MIKIVLSFLIGVFSIQLSAQVDSLKSNDTTGFPVVLLTDTLFYIHSSMGPYAAGERAQLATNRIEEALDKNFNTDSIKVIRSGEFYNVIFDSLIITAVTIADTQFTGSTQQALANKYAGIIHEKADVYFKNAENRNIWISIGIGVLFLVAAVFLFFGMKMLFPYLYRKLEQLEGKIFHSIKIRSQEIISAGDISSFFILLLKGIRLAVSLVIIYFIISYALSLIPIAETWNIRPLIRGFFYSIVLITATVAVYKALMQFFSATLAKIQDWRGTIIQSVKLKNLELLSDERIAEGVSFIIRVARFVTTVIVVYFFLTVIFSFFEFSRTWAGILLGYVLNPLHAVLTSFVNYLPDLFSILVIIFVTYYVIKFTGFIFREIERGVIAFPQFPPEWAEPTFKIARFAIIIFSAIVIFPHLPGSDSPVFRGISIFLGVLFSLGSTSAVANIVGGVVITYMRPFKINDRVRIADTEGDVIEKTLLVTRVRTVKNIDVTIPNSIVLGSHIINYSSSAKKIGLILHTAVTIGYDVPWKKVHEALINAAHETENISRAPKPFVLQKSLDDFYVTYELNAYTMQPSVMTKTYSGLHQNIQDKFNEAGIEIMSPHYASVRDGNKTAIPDDYLPESYEPPAFKILPWENPFKKNQNKKPPDR